MHADGGPRGRVLPADTSARVRHDHGSVEAGHHLCADGASAILSATGSMAAAEWPKNGRSACRARRSLEGPWADERRRCHTPARTIPARTRPHGLGAGRPDAGRQPVEVVAGRGRSIARRREHTSRHDSQAGAVKAFDARAFSTNDI